MKPHPIRVLTIDDSAYMRKVITEMLQRDPRIQVVGTAWDGKDALEKTAELHPDVVTLDMYMPDMDGLGYIQEQMKRRPVPIVLVTAAGQDQEQVVAAMEIGAVDFVMKPTSRATEQIYSLADDLLEKVITAAEARAEMLIPTTTAPQPESLIEPSRPSSGAIQAIVMGISTGGPQALRVVLPGLPKDLPAPIAIVLHMPAGYTGPFAHRLNELSEIEVLEAVEGLEMQPGRAILAQAGKHMTFQREQNGIVSIHLSLQPDHYIHRPSVDVLFQSAAEVYGEHTLGVVMTGMGDDGTLGAAWIKTQGGLIFTEAEESCVVYGMPRSVVEAGLSDRIVQLKELSRQIQETL